jgi:hypothetical protein
VIILTTLWGKARGVSRIFGKRGDEPKPGRITGLRK